MLQTVEYQEESICSPLLEEFDAKVDPSVIPRAEHWSTLDDNHFGLGLAPALREPAVPS